MLSGVFVPSSILTVLISTGFIFFMTCAGSAVVLFFKKDLPDWLQRLFLGLAAGIMIASSIWSLLLPAIEQSKGRSLPDWLPASLGFLLGSFCLLFLERFLSQMIKKRFKKIPNFLLFLAITLHNIPEGMAVSVPLISGGMPRWKAVLITAASGLPTIAGALLGYWLGEIGPLGLTLSLGFASGAMLYVVFGEILPQSILMYHSKLPAFSAIIGILAGLLIIF